MEYFFIPSNWVEFAERRMHPLDSPLVCCICQSCNAHGASLANQNQHSETHSTCLIDVKQKAAAQKAPLGL